MHSGGADGCEQMRVVRCDNMFIIQLQGSDKSSLQLRKEVKRPAKEGNVSADRFTAGKTRNGLVDNCLEMEAERSSLVAPSLI